MQLEHGWGNKLPGVTRSQLTRVLRELLPRRCHTPADLRQWRKYVASRTLKEPLAWRNSTLLQGDAAEAVAGLKQQGKDLLVFGSGEPIQSLLRHHLIDRFVLMIHPLVLGSGRRLFADGGAFAALRLVDAKTTPSGVAVAIYEEEGVTS